MNVALYRCQDDLATADRGGIAFDEGGLDDLECRLRHACGLDQLGQKDLALFKQLSGAVQCRDQNVIDHFHGVGGFQ